jgi:hypothetical protein
VTICHQVAETSAMSLEAQAVANRPALWKPVQCTIYTLTISQPHMLIPATNTSPSMLLSVCGRNCLFRNARGSGSSKRKKESNLLFSNIDFGAPVVTIMSCQA